MSYLRSVEIAIEYIENQIKDEELDVSSVCEHVGVSKWYFQRIFRGLTGDSLGNYIRKRRLSESALELVETDKSIIQLAFDYGYDSQEAFTRAFKIYFESTPALFRKNQDPRRIMHKFELTRAFLRHLKEHLIMEPVFEKRNKMILVGFKAPFNGVFDNNPNNHEVIPGLWQSLMTRLDDIPHQVKGYTYGIVECQTVNGEEKPEYLAAVEVESLKRLPDGMSSYVLPSSRIVKFTHKGGPREIDKTIKYVFGTWLPQSDNNVREGVELEIYPANYDPNDPNCSFEYCLLLQQNQSR